MKYESPAITLIANADDAIMTSLEGMNVVDLWDMLIDNA
jgi:hypothetical protein